LAGELSFEQKHSEEESQVNNFGQLIKKILCAGAHSSSAEFYSALFLHADQMMDSIQRHFQDEEAEVRSTLGV